MANEDWKWKKSSRNAFDLISGFFGVNPSELIDVTDEKTRQILQESDKSEVQVKRVQDAVRGVKKTWRNQLRIGTQLHSLVREGLSIITQQRRQEAETTKQFAKNVTDTRVLSAKTNTTVQKTYQKGAKQIEQSGNNLRRYTEELNDQYQVADSQANQASQQRRVSYRERTQRRLATNSRPWRNY